MGPLQADTEQRSIGSLPNQHNCSIELNNIHDHYQDANLNSSVSQRLVASRDQQQQRHTPINGAKMSIIREMSKPNSKTRKSSQVIINETSLHRKQMYTTLLSVSRGERPNGIKQRVLRAAPIHRISQLARLKQERSTFRSVSFIITRLGLFLMLILAATHILASANEVSSNQSPRQEQPPAIISNDNNNKIERRDTSLGGKTEQSIVASLSSAVASAAAAAAVAAAQAHSLASSDARSLAAADHRHQQRQQTAQRAASGLNLAMKMAVETIPEVPYNILHNMKKLDHAAPFYNVPNKLSGGSGKELSGSGSSPSASSILGSALLNVAQAAAGAASHSSGAHHGGRLGGVAAEQLGNLFRSPILKRLADSYDGFASEFRSLFKVPLSHAGGHNHHSVTPIKGSLSQASGLSSGTSKLIRDISMPALLMLLASSLSGTEWRPVRTRRKSLSSLESLPAKSPISNLVFNEIPQLQQQQQPVAFENLLTSASTNLKKAASLNGLDFSNSKPFKQPQQQQAAEPHASSETNFGSLAGNQVVQSSWMPNSEIHPYSINGLQMQGNNFEDGNLSPFQQQPQFLQPTMKRSGELVAGEEHNELQLAQTHQPPQFEKRSDSSSAGSLTSLDQHQNQHQRASSVVAKLFSTASEPISRLLYANSGSKQQQNSYTLLGSHSQPQQRQLDDHDQQQQSSFLAKQLAAAKSFISGSAADGSSHIIHFEDATKPMHKRNQLTAEQRDLTKLLPESWREVVKRTMSTVQQQANAQWKVVEGQLATWVQDKLRSVAVAGSPASSSSSGGSSTSAAGSPASSPAMSNIIASVSSTALNILGLNKNQQSGSKVGSNANSATQQVNVAQTSTDRSSPSESTSGGSTSTASTQKGKTSELTKKKLPSLAADLNAPLTGVANMLVQSIRGTSSSSLSNSQSSLPSESPNSSNHSNANANSKHQKVDEEKQETLLSAATKSIASSYPTSNSLTVSHQSEAPQSNPAAPSAMGNKADLGTDVSTR